MSGACSVILSLIIIFEKLRFSMQETGKDLRHLCRGEESLAAITQPCTISFRQASTTPDFTYDASLEKSIASRWCDHNPVAAKTNLRP
jgi:hypothetical protein